jgi:hypothetical protein
MMHSANAAVPPLPPSDAPAEPACRFPALSAAEVLTEIREKCAPCLEKNFGAGRHSLIFLPEAWKELAVMTGYGHRRPFNLYEQQYQAMGHIFVSGENAVTLVVSHVLYIYSASRTPVSASVSDGNDTIMYDRLAMERHIYATLASTCNRSDGYLLDPFLEKYGLCETPLLFGHTHPDLGGYFFSSTDLKSGYACRNFPAAIYVMDPIRLQMKAAVGLSHEDARVIVFSYAAEEREPAAIGRQLSAVPAGQESAATGALSDAAAVAAEQIAQLDSACSRLLQMPAVKGGCRVQRGFDRRLSVRIRLKLR